MRIKLIQDVICGNETCSTGEEYEAVLILPRSTTVEFVASSGKKVRAFSYEYVKVESLTDS
jgi:hypothetical protein